MIVEVIARQVGKHGHVKLDAGGAALVEPVAGDFGDKFRGALRCDSSAISSKRSRDSGVVCSEGRVSPATWYSMVPIRGCLAGRAIEQRFDEKCGRGFSVGAGDAGGGELFFRMVEEGGGRFREGAAAMLDFEHGEFGIVDEQMIEGGRRSR